MMVLPHLATSERGDAYPLMKSKVLKVPPQRVVNMLTLACSTGLRQRLLSWIQVFIQTREMPGHQTNEVSMSALAHQAMPHL
jgi:hypothetical protein